MTTEPQALPELSEEQKARCHEIVDVGRFPAIEKIRLAMREGIALGRSTLTAQPVGHVKGLSNVRWVAGQSIPSEGTPLYAYPAPDTQSVCRTSLLTREQVEPVAWALCRRSAQTPNVWTYFMYFETQDSAEYEAAERRRENQDVEVRTLYVALQAPAPASEDVPVVLPLPDSWLRWSDAGSTAVWNEESMREYGDARVLADRQSRAQPSTREAEPGWSTIAVNEHFAALMAEIDHAARKGQLSDETCDIWAAFNYRAAAAALDIKAGS